MAKKNKKYKPTDKNTHSQQWDIYKQKDKNGILIDGRSGETKFYRGGRKKDISLDKLDSYEDKKIEADLMRRWAAGEFGPPPKHIPKTATKQIPKKKNKGKKK